MKKCIFIFILSLLISACHKKADKLQIITNEKTSKLDSLFIKYFESETFNGNVLIAEKGTVIFAKSFGLANEATKERLNLETSFGLASVSKQFTAMGIVQLKKEGKLSYNDALSKHIPELSNYNDITIKNLLTHTSGLPDYMEIAEKHWDKTKIAANEDIIMLFKTLKPKVNFKPNEKWEYSNTGYLLLATIIERLSKKTFNEYLNETIFKPLGMTSTFVYRRRYQPKKVENYAQGYIFSDSLNKKILPDELGKSFLGVYLDGSYGDGGISSNLSDLLKWDRALYQEKIITKEEKTLIFSSYKTKDGKETDYGFGWKIDSSQVYGKIVNHSGGWGGYISYIERHLDNDKTIILLQNNSTDKTIIPVKNTRKILYNLPIENRIVLDSNILKLYAGKYKTSTNKEKEILFENGKLYVPMNPVVKLELIPVSKTKFIVDGFSPEVTYTFSINKNGDVKSYRVQQIESKIDKIALRIN
jgi:CubicO group peptidase (beta-lactamase class C family)